MSDSVVIWRFTDGKPGHENQTQGLCNAIAQQVSASIYTYRVPKSTFALLLNLLLGRFHSQLSQFPSPDYLMAAGRSTHLPLLLARCFFGGKSIVLMRSFYPQNWFNFSLIPEHDAPKPTSKPLVTKGVINTVTPSNNHDSSHGLILIGGVSKHYEWDNENILKQISCLLAAMPNINWTISNSRRTPAALSALLKQLPVHYFEHEQTNPDWLPSQLANSGQVWVSPDSVSMVYEALTSGARVGCFNLIPKKASRVVKGLNALMKQGMLTSFENWQSQGQMHTPPYQLNEAQRAANWILSQ